MDARRFQIEFFGGPEDGLRVRAVAFPGRTVLMRVGWSTSQAANPADTSPLGAGRAQYRLALSRNGVDAENRPVVDLRYEYVGVCPQERHSQARRFAARLWKMLGLRRRGGRTMKYRDRFAAWMLAPIDYPLRISPALSPTTSRDARQSTQESDTAS